MAQAVKPYLGKYPFTANPVTIYHLPSQSSSSAPDTPPRTLNNPLFVFIPGNPGIVDYYIPYLNHLHEAYPWLETLCISHIAQDALSIDKNSANKDRIYTLEEQISSKVEIIQNFLDFDHGDFSALEKKKQQTQTRDVIIMGHSVGSFMVQRVVHRFKARFTNTIETTVDSHTKPDFKLVGLLFPTIIDIAKSDSGTTFTTLFRIFPNFHHYVASLTSLVNFILPRSVIESLIRNIAIKNRISAQSINAAMEDNHDIAASNKVSFASDTEPQTEAADQQVLNSTKKLVCHPEVVMQALGLAKDEMEKIKNDTVFNDEFFQLSGDSENNNVDNSKSNYKIWTFFAQKDHWVSDKTRDYIKLRYFADRNPAQYKFQICDATEDKLKLKHSFVIEHSQRFAEVSKQTLEELLGF